jgi:predicted HicB family RNase H-like nuclease
MKTVTGEKDLKKRVDYYMSLPYTMMVKYHEEQGGYYVAGYLELPDMIMTGDTPEEAVKELVAEKPEWFEACLELGIPIPEPQTKYSGNINIRVDPVLHADLAQEAAAYNMSLNKYTALILERRKSGRTSGAYNANPVTVGERKSKYKTTKH